MDVDFESMLKSLPQADKRYGKKVAQADQVADSLEEPKRTKTKAFTRTSSNQLIIEADKSPKVGNKVSTAGTEASTAGTEASVAGIEVSAARIEEQPTRSAHQASFLAYATHHRSSQRIEMLETELCQMKEQRDVVAKKWSDAEAEVSRTKDEAEKQHQADQKIKELENFVKFLQANLVKRQVNHDQKLKELEA
uniref:Uncharacterized protein n=1 Tax=Cannabis sativa TaxID=3483 RepID=A0A803QBP1_CANSA